MVPRWFSCVLCAACTPTTPVANAANTANADVPGTVGWRVYWCRVPIIARPAGGLQVERISYSIRSVAAIHFNAHQVLARAYVLQNRRADAIASLQKSVRLNNNSDWQLLVELTNLEEQAAASKGN